jgi:hypothetical protein
MPAPSGVEFGDDWPARRRRGPFIMNDPLQIEEAGIRYRMGAMGHLAPRLVAPGVFGALQ